MTEIYEAQDHLLIRAAYADPAEHRHLAAHIILSMNGPICVRSGGGTYRCEGILIPSGVPHLVDRCERDVLVFLFDATSGLAGQITEIRCIPKDDCRRMAEQYAALAPNCTADRYRRFTRNLFEQLGMAEPTLPVRDARIAAAMAYIDAASAEALSCREVAAVVCLSEGRFSHLFKAQVGMTFSAYRIYRRLMHVYAGILQGRSITEAALEAGFSSSAHFADVNRRVFGTSAGSITRHAVFTKVR